MGFPLTVFKEIAICVIGVEGKLAMKSPFVFPIKHSSYP